MRKGTLATAVGALGAAAAGAASIWNRSITQSAGQLEPQLSVQPTYWPWRYGDVAVYETGSAQNPPMLLLHGHNAAASAFEMRQPFERFARHYHVFAPDLIGYGLSDRPDIDYTPELYIELIEDILREVVQAPAVVVASSLTSAHAIEVSAANPEWVTALVLICPTGVRNLTEQRADQTAFQTVLSLPLVGQTAFNGIASRVSIRTFLKRQTYHDPALVTPQLVEAQYRTAHVEGAHHAPLAFVAGKLYHDAGDAWRRLERASLLVWGREASITPVTDAAAFLATNPRADLQEISPAGLLPHDEQPEQFANIVLEWLRQQPAV